MAKLMELNVYLTPVIFLSLELICRVS